MPNRKVNSGQIFFTWHVKRSNRIRGALMSTSNHGLLSATGSPRMNIVGSLQLCKRKEEDMEEWVRRLTLCLSKLNITLRNLGLKRRTA